MQHDIPEESVQIVRNMVQSTTFRILLDAVRSRTPSRPSTEQGSDKASHQAFLRQGYEIALETLTDIAFESPEADLEVPAILDPRD